MARVGWNKYVPLAGLFLALATPVLAESIQLEHQQGLYMVPVKINDTLTIPFIVDSGASVVVIPADVFSTLRRTGTVSQTDFRGTVEITLADGSKAQSDNYLIHKMVVGSRVIQDVTASVSPTAGEPLLGQSFLSKLPAWTLDNTRHILILNDDAERSGEKPPQAARGAHYAGPATTHDEYLSYLATLTRQHTNLLTPVIGDRRGETVISVIVYENGAIGPLSVIHGSGYPDIDRRIEDMVAAVGKFPPLPQWYAGHAMGLQLTLRFPALQRPDDIAIDFTDTTAALPTDPPRGPKGSLDHGEDLARQGNEAFTAHNYTEAVSWYRKAADRGNAYAMWSIGQMYLFGTGVATSCALAKQWLERAAAAGSEGARHNLGPSGIFEEKCPR
jgi:clan AA aspartic protease (TIGR02281 family)